MLPSKLIAICFVRFKIDSLLVRYPDQQTHNVYKQHFFLICKPNVLYNFSKVEEQDP